MSGMDWDRDRLTGIAGTSTEISSHGNLSRPPALAEDRARVSNRRPLTYSFDNYLPSSSAQQIPYLVSNSDLYAPASNISPTFLEQVVSPTDTAHFDHPTALPLYITAQQIHPQLAPAQLTHSHLVQPQFVPTPSAGMQSVTVGYPEGSTVSQFQQANQIYPMVPLNGNYPLSRPESALAMSYESSHSSNRTTVSSESKPRGLRTQFSACQTCRARRVKCDLKDVQEEWESLFPSVYPQDATNGALSRNGDVRRGSDAKFGPSLPPGVIPGYDGQPLADHLTGEPFRERGVIPVGKVRAGRGRASRGFPARKMRDLRSLAREELTCTNCYNRGDQCVDEYGERRERKKASTSGSASSSRTEASTLRGAVPKTEQHVHELQPNNRGYSEAIPISNQDHRIAPPGRVQHGAHPYQEYHSVQSRSYYSSSQDGSGLQSTIKPGPSTLVPVRPGLQRIRSSPAPLPQSATLDPFGPTQHQHVVHANSPVYSDTLPVFRTHSNVQPPIVLVSSISPVPSNVFATPTDLIPENSQSRLKSRERTSVLYPLQTVDRSTISPMQKSAPPLLTYQAQDIRHRPHQAGSEGEPIRPSLPIPLDTISASGNPVLLDPLMRPLPPRRTVSGRLPTFTPVADLSRTLLTEVPDLQKEFLSSPFYRRFHIQRPICDPIDFTRRYLSHDPPQAAHMGPEGSILCHIFYAWASSYGVDQIGELDVPERYWPGGVLPPEEGYVWNHDQKRERDRLTRRAKTDVVVGAILKEIDDAGIMRRHTWDGVRCLLLILPLTEYVSTPMERLAMYECAVAQVFALCSLSAIGYDGLQHQLGPDGDVIRVRLYWYTFVHEGITSGLKGGRLVLDDDDLEAFQSTLRYGWALVSKSSSYKSVAKFATAPIRLAMACRLIHKALTGPKARRKERVDKSLMNDAWEALEACWEEFERIRQEPAGEFLQKDDIIRFADGWRIFMFEAHNVIRESLQHRCEHLVPKPEEAFLTDLSIADGGNDSRSRVHTEIQHLHDIARDKCDQLTRLIVDIVKRHINTSFFEWDASLVRDGTFYAATLLAKENGTEQDVAVCLQALNEMRWAYSKTGERSNKLRNLWIDRQASMPFATYGPSDTVGNAATDGMLPPVHSLMTAISGLGPSVIGWMSDGNMADTASISQTISADFMGDVADSAGAGATLGTAALPPSLENSPRSCYGSSPARSRGDSDRPWRESLGSLPELPQTEIYQTPHEALYQHRSLFGNSINETYLPVPDKRMDMNYIGPSAGIHLRPSKPLPQKNPGVDFSSSYQNDEFPHHRSLHYPHPTSEWQN